MPTDVRPLKPSSNLDILNAIRRDADLTYQRRIPEATKANIQETLRGLQTNRPLMNEFIDSLVNRIGQVIVRNNNWTNPFAEFKRGLLPYGDTIEEIQTGLLEAHKYDPDREYLEKDIFGTERPEVQANYHKVNREDFYKVTINDALLQRAFLDTQGGLHEFINSLMEAPNNSDQLDEFLLTVQLFAEYENNGGFYKVQVPDVSALTSNEADARATLRKMRAMADTLTFLSTRYNAAHMPTFAKRDDLVIFCTPEFNAAVDVEALAGAFNIEKASAYGRIIPIPAEHFGIKGAQAIMTTRDFFVMADQRFETTTAFNPAGLHNNYFLHHWQVVSASRFVPAVLFTTDTVEEIVIDPTPVTGIKAIEVTDRNGGTVTKVKRGEVYNLNSDAVTTPAGGVNDGVRWALTGSQSPMTVLRQTGVLHVAPDEPSTSLIVTAITTWIDPDADVPAPKTATVTLGVVGDKADAWPVGNAPEVGGGAGQTP